MSDRSRVQLTRKIIEVRAQQVLRIQHYEFKWDQYGDVIHVRSFPLLAFPLKQSSKSEFSVRSFFDNMF